MNASESDKVGDRLVFVTDTLSGVVAVEIAKPDLEIILNKIHEAYHPDTPLATEVSRFMDQAPQYPMPGGFAHRIYHGHSLPDLVSIHEKFGIEGVRESFKHMAADFCSPEGLPIPFAHSLMNQFDMNVHEAVNSLCFNAADVVSDAYVGTSLLPLPNELRCVNSTAKLGVGISLHSKAAVFTGGLSLVVSLAAIFVKMAHITTKDLLIRDVRNVLSENAVITRNVPGTNPIKTSNI